MALILDKITFTVYISKTKEGILSDTLIDLQKQLSITHFYFGVDKKEESTTTAESHVTVTNVLLYNRPFQDNEIGKLKEDFEQVEVPKTLDDNTNTTGSSIEQTPTKPPGTNEEKKDEKAPSPSRTEDGGVGGGVRVFSLLLALLCVSAPLLHL